MTIFSAAAEREGEGGRCVSGRHITCAQASIVAMYTGRLPP